MKRLLPILAILIAMPAMSAQPLQVMFANPEPELCRSIYIPTMMPIFERPAQDSETGEFIPNVYEIRFGIIRTKDFIKGYTTLTTELHPRTMAVVTGIEAANTSLLEFLIRINGLDLTPDDFRDQITGEFVCTNEKLFSLT